MDNLQAEKKYPWYHTVWGIVLIALGVVVVALAVVFLMLAFQFWREIKKGNGEALQQKFYGNSQEVKTNGNRLKLENDNSPYLGPISAPIVIVEFVDFKCPVCKNTYPIMHKINSNFKDKVKIIFRNFPVESIHPGTNNLAQLGVCASEQGKFWEVHDYLFSNQNDIPDSITSVQTVELGVKMGLDKKQLNNCIDNVNTITKVNKDFELGSSLGVQGTPTFFVNGEKIEGDVPWEAWKQFFEQYNNQ